jgi:hypothetical protein
MIKCEMLWKGSVGTARWYMAEEEPPTFEDGAVKLLPRCDDPGVFDGLPR